VRASMYRYTVKLNPSPLHHHLVSTSALSSVIFSAVNHAFSIDSSWGYGMCSAFDMKVLFGESTQQIFLTCEHVC